MLINVVFFLLFCFFFNDTATTEIYTLSLHDALPISTGCASVRSRCIGADCRGARMHRSEEHTSELQSRPHLVCRLLLEKKKKTGTKIIENPITQTHPFPAYLDLNA